MDELAPENCILAYQYFIYFYRKIASATKRLKSNRNALYESVPIMKLEGNYSKDILLPKSN